jgi:hypothetical protein
MMFYIRIALIVCVYLGYASHSWIRVNQNVDWWSDIGSQATQVNAQSTIGCNKESECVIVVC